MGSCDSVGRRVPFWEVTFSVITDWSEVAAYLLRDSGTAYRAFSNLIAVFRCPCMVIKCPWEGVVFLVYETKRLYT